MNRWTSSIRNWRAPASAALLDTLTPDWCFEAVKPLLPKCDTDASLSLNQACFPLLLLLHGSGLLRVRILRHLGTHGGGPSGRCRRGPPHLAEGAEMGLREDLNRLVQAPAGERISERP